MINEEITIQKIIHERSMMDNRDGLVAPLGINKTNQIQYADYSKIANLLICGTTGSGKTTFVRTLITSLISGNSPDNVKFCIFDSRGNDYVEFSKIPHLLIPVIYDARKCNAMISYMLYEANKRMADMSNKTSTVNYPDIFIVLDDYAEVAKKLETREELYELLHIAHRVKIHIIIVTSLALAKIVSTELKVHIPHRISFFLPEKINSRVVLDENGAETLEMPGEFIAKFYSKSNKYYSIQLADVEIEKNCDCINWKASNDGEDSFLIGDTMTHSQFGISNEEEMSDEMLFKAIDVVVESQMASTTLLQRNLKIGYARAVRIIDELEQRGIVGSFEGDKPRKVLISKQQGIEMNALSIEESVLIEENKITNLYTEKNEAVQVVVESDMPKENLFQRLKKEIFHK